MFPVTAQDPFDELMSSAFPEGLPVPPVVVQGGDHVVYHLLEALAQAYDMLSACETLNVVVEAEAPGWTALQQADVFSDRVRERMAEDNDFQWARDMVVTASTHLARWLHDRSIPRVFLWVRADGHGMVPFILEASQCRNGDQTLIASRQFLPWDPN